MKPSRIAILIAVILLVVGGTTAFAASSGAVQQPNTNCAFRDADGNGICDVCGAADKGAALNSEKTNGNTSLSEVTFVDSDGDGICDNCPAAQTTTSSRGQGNAWHHTEHAGHGHQTGHHWGGHHGC